MRNQMFAVVAVGGLAIAVAMPAAATSISAKLKSSKVQGDLVPAFSCGANDDTADCSGGSVSVKTCSGSGAHCGLFDDPCPDGETCTEGNITKSALNGKSCTFEKGTFKIQSGKDVQVQVSKLSCTGGVPPQICGHVMVYVTLANANVGPKGEVTPVTCPPIAGSDPAGGSTFTSGSIGSLTCDSKGTCKGVLQNASNPCQTDTVVQIASLDVFDGPKFAEINANNSGTILKACCGKNQLLFGNVSVDAIAPCTEGGQDVVATMGYVINLK